MRKLLSPKVDPCRLLPPILHGYPNVNFFTTSAGGDKLMGALGWPRFLMLVYTSYFDDSLVMVMLTYINVHEDVVDLDMLSYGSLLWLENGQPCLMKLQV